MTRSTPAVPINVAKGQAVAEGVAAVLVRARHSRTLFTQLGPRHDAEPARGPEAQDRHPTVARPVVIPADPTDHDLRQRIPGHVADGDGGQSPIVMEEPATTAELAGPCQTGRHRPRMEAPFPRLSFRHHNKISIVIAIEITCAQTRTEPVVTVFVLGLGRALWLTGQHGLRCRAESTRTTRQNAD
jgi:hypothetical protein